ncbi:MAG TPA: cysteine-rich small domain-containing protein [Candidatus Faecivivens stercorigallinarum]|nr:cysteine-rich small domain-containing protein [Candidatus Faecivivens stercorigallinarum]
MCNRQSSINDRHYAFFSNRDCEYFPCHPGADPDNFNCLFCYCPLYLLGEECGGNFRWLENGVKDCSDCLFPHRRENYDVISARWQEIAAAMPHRR